MVVLALYARWTVVKLFVDLFVHVCSFWLMFRLAAICVVSDCK